MFRAVMIIVFVALLSQAKLFAATHESVLTFVYSLTVHNEDANNPWVEVVPNGYASGFSVGFKIDGSSTADYMFSLLQQKLWNNGAGSHGNIWTFTYTDDLVIPGNTCQKLIRVTTLVQ